MTHEILGDKELDATQQSADFTESSPIPLVEHDSLISKLGGRA